MNQPALFSYISGKSIFHRLPAEFKVFLLLICTPLLFFTNVWTCIICMFFISFFSCICKINFKQQLNDIKPIMFYSFFLIIVGIISVTYTYLFPNKAGITTTSFTLKDFLIACIPPKKTQLLILHLICTMQFTSLFFKTTTSLQLKDALENIETKISFGKSSGIVSQTFSLFLNFIPIVFSVWKQIDLAWKSKNGKNNILKYTTLLPVFISISLKKAQQTYLALENRR